MGLIAHINSYYRGDAGFPLLIHGALDFVPSLIAAKMFGVDHVIVSTRAINLLISGINYALFSVLLSMLLVRSGCPSGARRIVVLCVLFVFGFNVETALQFHQGILNPRELFLLAFFVLIASYSYVESSFVSRNLVLFLIAIVTATSVYWSYDRGLINVVGFAIFVASLILQRRYMSASYVVGLAVILSALLNYVGWFGEFSENMGNVLYWVENGHIWRYEYTAKLARYSIPLVFLVVALAFCYLSKAVKSWRCGDHHDATLRVIFVVSLLAMLRSALNRPDDPHMLWCFWLAVAMTLPVIFGFFANGAESTASSEVLNSSRFTIWQKAGGLLLFILLFASVAKYNPSFKGAVTLKSIRQALSSPVSDDRIFADPALGGAHAFFSALKPDCVLSWSNSGLTALVSGLKFCGDVVYPVYISPSAEPAYYDKLSKNLPAAIVYDANFWGMEIDEKRMENRLPSVNKLIESNYVEAGRFGGWVVLKRN